MVGWASVAALPQQRPYEPVHSAWQADCTDNRISPCPLPFLSPQGQQLVAGGAQQQRSVFRVSLEPGPTNMNTIAQAGGAADGGACMCKHVWLSICVMCASWAIVCMPMPCTSPPCLPNAHSIHPPLHRAHNPAAKRVLGNINVQYSPSGQVARRLGVSHRTLGRMTGGRGGRPGGCVAGCLGRGALGHACPCWTWSLLCLHSHTHCPSTDTPCPPFHAPSAGNVWLQAGEERRDRVDVGLCVKNGGKGLYVPDFARPLMEGGDAKGEGSGWGCRAVVVVGCLFEASVLAAGDVWITSWGS